MAAALLDLAGMLALVLGLSLATIGLYGMARKPGIFDQIHAAGLITGPATVLVLLASLATGNVEVITSAALLILFVLITSPLATHAIARAARRQMLARRLPGDGAKGDSGHPG
jgi:monovalent cation/proton antiporter MnhG/PhaG subunit